MKRIVIFGIFGVLMFLSALVGLCFFSLNEPPREEHAKIEIPAEEMLKTLNLQYRLLPPPGKNSVLFLDFIPASGTDPERIPLGGDFGKTPIRFAVWNLDRESLSILLVAETRRVITIPNPLKSNNRSFSSTRPVGENGTLLPYHTPFYQADNATLSISSASE